MVQSPSLLPLSSYKVSRCTDPDFPLQAVEQVEEWDAVKLNEFWIDFLF
jgi:hypothetical protein